MPATKPPPRKRDAEATRGRILETAEKMFVRQGFDGTRVDAIAEVARVNKRMIYVYFVNKEGLYLEVLKKNFAEVAKLDHAIDPALSSDAQAAAVIRHYFHFLADHPAFVRLLGWETLNDGRLAGRALVDVAAAEFETLHGILRNGVEQGIFRADLDIPKTVMSITALCFGFFNRRSLWATLWGEDLARPEALDAVLEHILALTFQGIRTSPTSGDAASTRP